VHVYQTSDYFLIKLSWSNNAHFTNKKKAVIYRWTSINQPICRVTDNRMLIFSNSQSDVGTENPNRSNVSMFNAEENGNH